MNDKNVDNFIHDYLQQLPDGWGNTKTDMYLAMKNAMLEALSYPEKYIIKK